MSGSSGNSASAMQNCARLWSIRRQRPRCLASSAARRQTCSRCSMPSSRAPLGFAALMTCCCDSARVTLWFPELILVPYPLAASPIRMNHTLVGCVSTARSTFPTSAQNDFPMMGSTGNYRTYLAAPLCQQGELIGRLIARRTEVHPFTPAQIKLMETFADQVVIAIENVRLFKEIQERNSELREALEHQTATSEVLGIISRSPTNVQPVLDAIVESAARVCGIDDVVLRLREGN